MKMVMWMETGIGANGKSFTARVVPAIRDNKFPQWGE